MANKKKKRRETREHQSNDRDDRSPSILNDGTLWLALASSIGLCIAFPPFKIWPIALVAPIGWLRLIRQETAYSRRQFVSLYVAGFVHWMILTQWVRLPHWSAYFGWIVLSAYLAVYIPAFVFATRTMVHQWRIPSVLAAPVAWTGLELARGYLFTGFSLSLLGHTVVNMPLLTQIADTFGAYGVSFVIMTVAAAIERCVPQRVLDRNTTRSTNRSALVVIGPAVWGASLLLVTILYGWTHVTSKNETSDGPGEANKSRVNVALIQAVYDTEFDNNKDVAQRRAYQAFDDYMRLSRQALTEDLTRVDVVIWPESMFSTDWRHQSYVTYDPNIAARPDLEMTLDEWQTLLEDCKQVSDLSFVEVAADLNSSLVVGLSRLHASGETEQRFNSAFHIDRSGSILGQYDKMHPVMFGEYVPFGETFPWLYALTPMGGGLTSGVEPKNFTINGVRFCPCICFENTVPHLIRQQIKTLAANGEEPDCLVTVTNDGWFWGSSLLDVHLACGVFRAIENRKPMLIAANTGFSAWIDEHGNVRAQGPRREEGYIHATITGPNSKISHYRRLEDWPAGLCSMLTFVALAASGRNRLKSQPI